MGYARERRKGAANLQRFSITVDREVNSVRSKITRALGRYSGSIFSSLGSQAFFKTRLFGDSGFLGIPSREDKNGTARGSFKLHCYLNQVSASNYFHFRIESFYLSLLNVLGLP